MRAMAIVVGLVSILACACGGAPGGGAAAGGGAPGNAGARASTGDGTVSSAAPTPSAAALLERFKAATGGAAWDGVASVEVRGTVAQGGLSGPVVTTLDTQRGRSVSTYTLGPLDGAEGFDGEIRWQQDGGGEVSALDAPEARTIARTTAWMNALGYWYPKRAAAEIGAPSTREDAGRRYLVVVATPAGGHAIELWFDPASSLLARTVERQAGETAITMFDDYRDVGGRRHAFHVVMDRVDTAGRTDPRERTEVRVDRVATNVPLAETAFAMPKMPPTARIANASGVTRVPFDLVNNHIYVDGSIGGVKARLLVDTGGTNVLTPAATKKLGIPAEGKLLGRGAGADPVDLAIARPADVRVGDAVLAKPVFYVLDLGLAEAIEGVPEDGLVGFEMFRRFRVSIDYQARVLTLTDPAKFQPPSGAHAVPFELADRIPIVRGTLDGVPVRLSIDTGSRLSLTLHSPFVREHDAIARYGAASERIVGWGVGGPSLARPARLGVLTIGDVTLRDLAGDLFTDDKGAFANPDLSGNIGGGVLRKFTVTFDYEAKRMYLAPNADFAKPDPFDRSGVVLAIDGAALKVLAVASGGPAERASLAKDDRITAIDGEAVTKRPLMEWRRRFTERPAGTHVALSLAGSPARKVDLVLADAIPPHATVR